MGKNGEAARGFGMLLKFAAPLLLFLSNALDAANNASYENTVTKNVVYFLFHT